MIRYQIQMTGPNETLDCGGMVERVAANGCFTEVTLWICRTNQERFEKLIEGSANVVSYSAKQI